MERQVLQVCSLGSFTVAELRLSSSRLLTAQNTGRGCARWFIKNTYCESPGKLHYPSSIKLWAALLQEHQLAPKAGRTEVRQRMRHWEGPSCLQTWMCVINTCPKATKASMCNMLVSLVSSPLHAGIHVPTPPGRWTLKNKWWEWIHCLFLEEIHAEESRGWAAWTCYWYPLPTSSARQGGSIQPASPPFGADTEWPSSLPRLMPVLPWVSLAHDALEKMDLLGSNAGHAVFNSLS